MYTFIVILKLLSIQIRVLVRFYQVTSRVPNLFSLQYRQYMFTILSSTLNYLTSWSKLIGTVILFIDTKFKTFTL